MNNKIKYIDLFCGIGAFNQAFKKFDSECVFSSDIDDHCRSIYNLNHNHKPNGDITDINYNEIPDHDVLVAGFPCQPFSLSGKQKGFNDTRGTLFFDICNIAKHKNTDTLLLENVKNLLHHNKGETLKVIINTLIELGYFVSYSLLNANNFGVPQNRERVIIVANKRKLFDFSNLSKYHNNVKLIDFLESNVDVNNYLNENDYTLLDEETVNNKSGLIFSGYLNKKIRIKGTNPDKINLSRTHKQPNRIYSALGVHPTLSAQEKSGRYYILLPNKKVRKLTMRECYRIMGFPDDFVYHSVKSQAYQQVGNSICVFMLESIIGEVVYQLY